MSYKFRPVVGSPKSGSGYPTVDKDGNVTLPGESKPFPPEKWIWLSIGSDAEQRDLSGMGTGSVAISPPPGSGQQPRNRARPSERRR